MCYRMLIDEAERAICLQIQLVCLSNFKHPLSDPETREWMTACRVNLRRQCRSLKRFPDRLELRCECRQRSIISDLRVPTNSHPAIVNYINRRRIDMTRCIVILHFRHSLAIADKELKLRQCQRSECLANKGVLSPTSKRRSKRIEMMDQQLVGAGMRAPPLHIRQRPTQRIAELGRIFVAEPEVNQLGLLSLFPHAERNPFSGYAGLPLGRWKADSRQSGRPLLEPSLSGHS